MAVANVGLVEIVLTFCHQVSHSGSKDEQQEKSSHPTTKPDSQTKDSSRVFPSIQETPFCGTSDVCEDRRDLAK